MCNTVFCVACLHCVEGEEDVTGKGNIRREEEEKGVGEEVEEEEKQVEEKGEVEKKK